MPSEEAEIVICFVFLIFCGGIWTNSQFFDGDVPCSAKYLGRCIYLLYVSLLSNVFLFLVQAKRKCKEPAVYIKITSDYHYCPIEQT